MMNISRNSLSFTTFLLNSSKNNILATSSALRAQSTQTPLPTKRTQLKSMKNVAEKRESIIPSNYRFVYPEFLPDPDMTYRHPIREKLERQDMLNRRSQIDIPEFYVGSIMAATISDIHSLGKSSRFVGICIDREGCGLRSTFVLRNVIDHQGVEVKYSLYDPTIQKIEVLRLEKRLDEKLYYLRDAPLEYSTFDPNMDIKHHPEGEPISVNTTVVTLRPRPWTQRWERAKMAGISIDSINEHITDKMRSQIPLREEPWEPYDLMKAYRKTISEEEQHEIFSEVHPKLNELQQKRKTQRRTRAAQPKNDE